MARDAIAVANFTRHDGCFCGLWGCIDGKLHNKRAGSTREQSIEQSELELKIMIFGLSSPCLPDGQNVQDAAYIVKYFNAGNPVFTRQLVS